MTTTPSVNRTAPKPWQWLVLGIGLCLLLFVLVDGWILVMGTLATSYGVGT